MVKWLGEMSPVEMSIDSEHLSENHLADIDELIREA